MILNKNQIIDIYISDAAEEIRENVKRRLNRLPELSFLYLVKYDMNWSLDPIRKNLYIVTAQ